MIRRLVAVALMALMPSSAFAAFGGSCSVMAMKRNDFYLKPYPGTQAGFDQAKAYVGNAGYIQIGPGCEGSITVGSLPDSVVVLRANGGWWDVGGTVTTPRLGGYSTPTTGPALRIVDGVFFQRNSTGINKAVAEVKAAGGGTIVLPKGRYDISASIVLNGASNVTFAGQSDSTVLFLDHPTGTHVFDFQGTNTGVVIRDLTIDGDRSNNTAGRGITIGGTSRDILIQNVTVKRTNDAGIVTTAPVTSIIGCRLVDIGDGAGDGNGIQIAAAADSSRIENCDIRDTKDMGIRVDTDADHVSVVGNRVYHAAGGTIRFNEAGGKYGLIADNTFRGSDNTVLAWTGGDSLRIVNNVFTNGGIYSGLYLLRGKSVVISGNICSYNVHHGIFLGYDQGDCQDIIVSGNICSGNQGSGIIANPSTTRTFTNILIQGNVCTNNGSYGISTVAATQPCDMTIGPNYTADNGAGEYSLSTTNWTYNPVVARRLSSQGSLGSIDIGGATGNILDFTYGSTNVIRASNASGALHFQTGGTNQRMRIDATGLTTVNDGLDVLGGLNIKSTATFVTPNDLVMGTASEMQWTDASAVPRWFIRTGGGNNKIRFRPIAQNEVLWFENYDVNRRNLEIHDDGIIRFRAVPYDTIAAYASAGFTQNGDMIYCSDCTKATPCAAGGSGAFAFRRNSTWDCNPRRRRRRVRRVRRAA